MTFRECAAIACKSKPFEPLLQGCKLVILLFGGIILSFGVLVGPPILVEDYFMSRDMKGIFLLVTLLYWTILGLLASFGYTRFKVCDPEKEDKS